MIDMIFASLLRTTPVGLNKRVAVMKRWVLRLALSVTIVAMPAVAWAQAFPVTGQTAQIGKGGDGMPCFASTDDLDAFIKAAVANDKYGMVDAMRSAVILHRGDRVRTIDTHGWMAPYLRVRVESGDHEGTACWVQSDLKDFFVNVRG